MALYLVSYDIEEVDDAESRSENIRKDLKDIGGIWILYSQWILRKNKTNSVTIRDHLKRHLHRKDHLLVNELDLTRAAWFNMSKLDRIKTFN